MLVKKKKYENENDWVGPKKTAPFLRKKGSFFGSQAVTQTKRFFRIHKVWMKPNYFLLKMYLICKINLEK